MAEIKSKKDELAAERARLDAAQVRLSDERIKVYMAILDPYIEVLHELGRGLPAPEANQRLVSVEHRKAAFQLKIIGTDAVVNAFNAFTRYIVDAQLSGQDTPGEIVRRWADLVFAIRRSIGEPNSDLRPPDMIIDWVADIDSVYPELGPSRTQSPVGALTINPVSR